MASEFDGIFTDAVDFYWAKRTGAAGASVGAYGGRRSEVVGGKQLDGFLRSLSDVVLAAGVPSEWIAWDTRGQTLIPGWFRATKSWDLLVVEPVRGHRDPVLHAAVELKVLGGPSYGNNANNRAEEAIGNAVDLWKSYREGGFRIGDEPFVGYMILVEDTPKARTPVRVAEPYYRVFPEFQGASYIERMSLLCERLVAERLYTAACTITSRVEDHGRRPNYHEPNQVVGVLRFLEGLIRRVRPV